MKQTLSRRLLKPSTTDTHGFTANRAISFNEDPVRTVSASGHTLTRVFPLPEGCKSVRVYGGISNLQHRSSSYIDAEGNFIKRLGGNGGAFTRPAAAVAIQATIGTSYIHQARILDVTHNRYIWHGKDAPKL